jgi:RNA polymerase sporulation-specific sigma factor
LAILGWVLAVAAVVHGTLFLFAYLNNQVFPQPLGEDDKDNAWMN